MCGFRFCAYSRQAISIKAWQFVCFSLTFGVRWSYVGCHIYSDTSNLATCSDTYTITFVQSHPARSQVSNLTWAQDLSVDIFPFFPLQVQYAVFIHPLLPLPARFLASSAAPAHPSWMSHLSAPFLTPGEITKRASLTTWNTLIYEPVLLSAFLPSYTIGGYMWYWFNLTSGVTYIYNLLVWWKEVQLNGLSLYRSESGWNDDEFGWDQQII